MKQGQFETAHRPLWDALAKAVVYRSRRKDDPPDIDLPAAYRRLSHHLAVAKARHYSPGLIEELNQLALKCHLHLHGHQQGQWSRITRYISGGFARAIRREWRYVAVASILFFGSFAAMFTTVVLKPEMAYTVIDTAQAWEYEAMYSPDNQSLGRRENATDVMMFGFYIRNNTSIGLRTIGGGLLAGVGTLFFLLFNGIFIGTVAGHLTAAGLGNATFFPFVSGHSATELTAIALSGAAGLILGHSLLAPGRNSRLDSLKLAARRAMDLLWGIVIMFLLAAAIEAFWSSQTGIDRSVKYAFGGFQWALVILYFAAAGRQRAAG